MNQMKRYEDMPFQKKLFFVFGVSLVCCIVLAVYILTDYCTRILVNNNIDNLTIISRQVGIDFNRRISDTEKQLFNNITMFQIPDSMLHPSQNLHLLPELQLPMNHQALLHMHRLRTHL